MCWIDDHSRLALSVTAHHRVTGPIVVAAFRATVAAYGPRPRRRRDIQDESYLQMPHIGRLVA